MFTIGSSALQMSTGRDGVFLRGPKQETQACSALTSTPSTSSDQTAHGESYLLFITTLAPRYSLIRELPIVIEFCGTWCLAHFHEAGISSSGNGVDDAMSSLKDLICDAYEMLSELPEGQLGPEPRKQLDILQALIRPA